MTVADPAGAGFGAHLATLEPGFEAAFARCEAAGRPVDRLLLHAGNARHYHADDQELPFRSAAHFRRVAPIDGPGHWAIVAREGGVPRVLCVAPSDYWYEPPEALEDEIVASLSVELFDDETAAGARVAEIAARGRCAYLGPDADLAIALGVPAECCEPRELVAALDWFRAEKTGFEIECIRAACGVAAAGHLEARRAAAGGASEREIHARYLAASSQLDGDTPYPNIIAWNEHAAVLHYASKSLAAPTVGNNFLIDAGASVRGYASDITRSYARRDAHEVFRALLDGMAELQETLVQRVSPGVCFVELHEAALRGVAELLTAIGIARIGAEALIEHEFAHAFLPHGLGHHLGLQVHDVGGRQIAPDGTERPAPESSPMLRTTRELAPSHVVTIEPGLYFVPLLLGPLRERAGDAFDWSLVDALRPYGGIRLEDDVLVTATGHENLSRPFVPMETTL